jgi:tRNA-splicing ligase RtcB
MANREEMMDRVMIELSYQFYGENGHQSDIELSRINCHHNFMVREGHGDGIYWITRKGAIEASVGKLGMIPGSMGTSSYIVSGLGNEDSYCSAPHGAGRRLSRNQARKEYTLTDLEKVMGNIEFRHSDELVDEIPMAYKDIDVVIENSKDLVKVEHRLHQIMNIKGD